MMQIAAWRLARATRLSLCPDRDTGLQIILEEFSNMKKLIALAAAAALAAAPTAASAVNTASALSIAQETAAGSDDASEGGLLGSPEATAGVIVFSVIIIFSLLVAFDAFEGDDQPRSA